MERAIKIILPPPCRGAIYCARTERGGCLFLLREDKKKRWGSGFDTNSLASDRDRPVNQEVDSEKIED
jgi:hypothetical protein